MGRAPCCDKGNVKRGPWSPEEDSKLKDYITKHGTGGNWIALPQKAGLKRCGKSCRLRWLNYLRPNIKHGDFTDEEDRVICTLFATIGSRWSIIAAQLPGRTDNDIKNYWNTKLKKKLMAMAAPPTHHHHHHHHHHQYSSSSSSSSHHRKQITSPNIYHHQASSPLLSSSPKNPTSNFSYNYNYTPSTIPPKTFTCFQPTLSHQLSDQFNHLMNKSISSAVTVPESPQLQYDHQTNVSIYGGGSNHHHQIKQEVMSGQIMSFGQLQHLSLISSPDNNISGCEENQKSFIHGGDNDHGAVLESTHRTINLNHWAADQEAVSEVDYELEHFKQLIDSSSITATNTFFNVDDQSSSKTKQEVMFYN